MRTENFTGPSPDWTARWLPLLPCRLSVTRLFRVNRPGLLQLVTDRAIVPDVYKRQVTPKGHKPIAPFRPRCTDAQKHAGNAVPVSYTHLEDCMENTVSEGEETIVATTDDYIIFYKHKGFDVAYREYWRCV